MEDRDFIQRINDTMDPDEVVHALDLSTEELTELLYDTIVSSREKFEEMIYADGTVAL